MENPILLWIQKNYVDYDKLPELFAIVDEHLPQTNYSRLDIIGSVLHYLNKVVTEYDLKKDLELVKEYYDKCFLDKKIKHIHGVNTIVYAVLYLNDFPEGKELLKTYGIDLSKKDNKMRAAAYKLEVKKAPFFSNQPLNINKLREFAPKVIDFQDLLENHLALNVCQFINENGFEIQKKYLCQLVNKTYLSFASTSYEEKNINHKTMEALGNILIETKHFKDMLASSKNIHLAIYNYFDKVYSIPKEIKKILHTNDPNMSADMKMHYWEMKKNYFNNEFCKALYNHPAFLYVNLTTKLIQETNIKYSGTKFVRKEEEENNLEKSRVLDKPVKRKKI